MIKRILILLPLYLLCFGSQAQESLIRTLDYAMLDKLIELAKTNYPKRKINQENEKVAKSTVTMEALSYLDLVNASYIYRPNNRPSINPINPYVYNGFQVGVGLNLGSFIARPFRIRQAKQQLKITRLENEDFDNILENDVKAKYYLYVQLTSELKNKTSAAQDAKSLFDRLQGQFELGELDLDTYSTARANVASTNSALIQTEVSYLMAKDALEELIGVKLEEVK